MTSPAEVAPAPALSQGFGGEAIGYLAALPRCIQDLCIHCVAGQVLLWFSSEFGEDVPRREMTDAGIGKARAVDVVVTASMGSYRGKIGVGGKGGCWIIGELRVCGERYCWCLMEIALLPL